MNTTDTTEVPVAMPDFAEVRPPVEDARQPQVNLGLVCNADDIEIRDPPRLFINEGIWVANTWHPIPPADLGACDADEADTR